MAQLGTFSRATVRRVLGVGLLLAASMVAADRSSPAATRVPQPVIESARGGQCVEDPAFMRRNHADLLKHQRDKTVHGGVRTAKYSLKACIECHASQTTGSVAATQDNFCQSCHAFAAVKIDCFGCHASKPPQTPLHPLVSHAKPGDPPLGLQLRQMVVQQQVKP